MTNQATIPFINPATGVQFGEVPVTTPEGVEQAHQEMRAAFPKWSQTSVPERARILRRFQGVLLDALDEITAAVNRDNGKSRQDALLEVFVTLDLLQQYCKHAPRWLARERVPRGLALFKRCYVEYRPRGVVGVISPWNYPFALAMAPALSALLAGNTVLLKPSEVTAATGVLMEQLFARLQELTPFVRVLHGDGATGAAMVQSGPDYIFLTGSGPTARKVLRTAAENLTPVSCELGGKDAMLVLAQADIPKAARWGLWGAIFNAGQTCMGVERVYVVEPVYDRFVTQVVAEAKALKVGYDDGLENPHHLGPITMPRQLEIIEEHLQDAVSKGARLVSGGQRQGRFFEPTVVVDVDHRMRLMREETFGPVLPIMKVKDETEAIRLANDSEYGLGGSVWSRDIDRAEAVAHQLQAGSVLVNDSLVQFGVPLLPFGGVKKSGNGRTHGKQGLLEFTQSFAYTVGKPPLPFDLATIVRQPGHYRLASTLMHLVFGTTPQQKVRPLLKSARPERAGSTARKVATAGVVGGMAAVAFGLLWRLRR
jgi:acyl-CoA reductase-like NAD-dependent aldehyde dehydrogenase